MAGIVRLIRQICVLREQGHTAEAAHLQEDGVSAAVREFRRTQGAEALSESELQALFATEARRVAEAAILSELLVPRLVEALPAAPGRAATTGVRPVSSPPPVFAAPAVAAPAGPPAIPDLLDAMLAAERTSRRPAASVP